MHTCSEFYISRKLSPQIAIVEIVTACASARAHVLTAGVKSSQVTLFFLFFFFLLRLQYTQVFGQMASHPGRGERVSSVIYITSRMVFFNTKMRGTCYSSRPHLLVSCSPWGGPCPAGGRQLNSSAPLPSELRGVGAFVANANHSLVQQCRDSNRRKTTEKYLKCSVFSKRLLWHLKGPQFAKQDKFHWIVHD